MAKRVLYSGPVKPDPSLFPEGSWLSETDGVWEVFIDEPSMNTITKVKNQLPKEKEPMSPFVAMGIITWFVGLLLGTIAFVAWLF